MMLHDTICFVRNCNFCWIANLQSFDRDTVDKKNLWGMRMGKRSVALGVFEGAYESFVIINKKSMTLNGYIFFRHSKYN